MFANIVLLQVRVLGKLFKKKPVEVFVKTKMTTSVAKKRFLVNQMPDFAENQVEVPTEQIIKQINEYISDIRENFQPTERNGKDGLYLGTAGVAYMYYHLSKVPAMGARREELLREAVEYLRPALDVCTYEVNEMNIPGLLLGNCGVYAVASAVFAATGEEKESLRYRELYNDAAKYCKELNFLPYGSDELFVGRAGYICGAIWMSRQTAKAFKTEDIFDLCRIVVLSGKQYAQSTKTPSSLMYSYYDVEYLGAGHGICSILLILMSVPGYLDANPLDAKVVQDAVDYLLSLQDEHGNFPAATDEIKNQSNELIHWCHGAGGVVYLMAKAYLSWKNDKYLKACERAADLIWEKGLLRKGPGLCHGVAGNGYVFLLLHRLTGKDKYLHRAIKFSEFLEDAHFKQMARVPDNPHSLFEGIAGTVCFLSDMLQPQNAAFPFLDVF
ncbi:PREDICTED: lanC-like protein 3 homolog isoform X2 [Nicrophorus vespilloides]|uniref:LanC-like protein 3 homolog isoform X2 n=1 Tax=Nicrophorus vespilloides TaxID=110193 RepID=A0ABM1MKB7_NICVS|nr:PREDICTED: lanC-like protein 3 homolog isoform X2 [Nicrophorus vespilloides]